MKVWVVFSGEYEDRDVVAVFASEDKAVAYIEMQEKVREEMLWHEPYDYRCYDTDSIDVEPTEKRIFYVFKCKNGAFNVRQETDYDHYYHELAKDRYYGSGDFSCYVIANNVEEAVEVAKARVGRIEDELAEKHGDGWKPFNWC